MDKVSTDKVSKSQYIEGISADWPKVSKVQSIDRQSIDKVSNVNVSNDNVSNDKVSKEKIIKMQANATHHQT